MPTKIAVLASGDGSNFEALVAASRDGRLPAEIVGLMANRRSIPALERAERLGIPSCILRPSDFDTREAWDEAMAGQLKAWSVEWVALAGYLALVGPKVLATFPGRMINSHPALLPKFGGAGMYGMRVHQAVIAAGEKETGVTFHLVDEVYDHGRVLRQEKIPVLASDTPESLSARLKARENQIYPQVLSELIAGLRT